MPKVIQHNLRRSEQRYRYIRQLLRLSCIEFIGGETKGFGFWMKDWINPRTGSTWHSMEEARLIVRKMRFDQRLFIRSTTGS